MTETQPAPEWQLVPVEPTSSQINAATGPFLNWQANAKHTGGPIQSLGIAIYREMLAAAPQPAQAQAEWQIIETAPKNKTNVLLLRQPCGSVANGFWLAEAYARNGAWIWPYIHKTPTHWMPVPPIPASEAKGASHEQALEEALRERDEADDFIDTLLDEVLGADRAEWSSAYGRAEAMEEVRERITALHKPAVDRAWTQFAAADSVLEDAARYRLPKFLTLKFHSRRDKKATVTLLFDCHEVADAWVRAIAAQQGEK